MLALHVRGGEVSSPVTKLAPRAPEPDEPQALPALYLQARRDLQDRPQGCVVRWVFWHARAVGRLEVYRCGLKQLEQADWEANMRVASAWPATAHMEAAESRRPKDATMSAARELVIETAAYVEATRQVILLLKGET